MMDDGRSLVVLIIIDLLLVPGHRLLTVPAVHALVQLPAAGQRLATLQQVVLQFVLPGN